MDLFLVVSGQSTSWCVFFTCENQLKEQPLSAEPKGQTLRIEGSFKDKPKFEGWVKKEFLIARQLPPIWM